MTIVNIAKNSNQTFNPDDYKYWVFLSYSHHDEDRANWLHHSLEQYRIPRSLIGRSSAFGPLPNRLFPVFRDREELACASSLKKEIEKALQYSRYLVVICSPYSALSRWVNEEIKFFKKLGRSDRVLAIVVEGEPNATEKPDLGLLEAFPDALRFQVDQNGNVTNNRVELIAADLRSSGDGESGALLKLLSGILGVEYDELRQRERQRQIRQRLQFTVVVVVILAGIVGLWVNRQHVIRQQEQVVIAQQLATEAQQDLGVSGTNLTRQVLLAIESLKLAHTKEGHLALRSAMNLLPHKYAEFPHKGAMDDLSFSSDKTLYLASTMNDKSFSKTVSITDGELLTFTANGSHSILLNTETKTPVNRVDYKGEYGEVDLILPHPSEAKLATAIGETVRIWDVLQGKEISRLPHNGSVKDMAFIQDGKRIKTSSDEGLVRLWSVYPGTAIILQSDYLKSSQFGNFTLSLNGLRIASVDGETLRIWEMLEGKKVLEKKLEYQANQIVFSPNAELIATNSRDHNTVFITDAAISEFKFSLPHTDPVRGLQFSLDGKKLFTWSGKKIRVWALDTGQEIGHFLHENEVDAYALSPDGKQIASSSNGSTKIWDVENGTNQFQLQFRGKVKDMLFNHDGSFLATVSGSGVRLWDASSGKLLTVLPHDNLVEGIAINPHDNGLLTYSGNEIILWEARGKKERARLVHGIEIYGGSFDSKGKNVAVWGGEILRILANESGKEVATYNFDDTVKDVAFSPDNKFLIVMHWNGEIGLHLWQAEDLIKEACKRVTRNLTEIEWRISFKHETYRPTCPGAT